MGKLAIEDKINVLHCHVQAVQVCIDLQYIDKILLLPRLQEVPNGPESLTGLMNYHGKSIPIFDLAIALHLERQQSYGADTPVLLCHDNVEEVGLIVDKVQGLITIDKNCVQMDEAFDKETSPFMGSIAIQSQMALMMNIHNILSQRLSRTD